MRDIFWCSYQVEENYSAHNFNTQAKYHSGCRQGDVILPPRTAGSGPKYFWMWC